MSTQYFIFFRKCETGLIHKLSQVKEKCILSKLLSDVRSVKSKWTVSKASNHLRVEEAHQYFHLIQFIQTGSRPVLRCWTHTSLRSSALPKGSQAAVGWVRECVLIDTEQEMCRFNTRKAKRAVGWQQLWILQVKHFNFQNVTSVTFWRTRRHPLTFTATFWLETCFFTNSS